MFKLKRPSPEVGFYSPKEEWLNSVTHAIGIVLAVIGLLALVGLAWRYGDGWQLISLAIYGSSMVALYAASTLYHSARQPEKKRFFRYLDHAAIYLFIAGTYTPFLMVTMRGPFGWTMLALIWIIALAGVAFKTLFVGRYETLATLGYVLMGWLAVLTFRQMTIYIPAMGIWGLLLGGVIYTIGVIFLAWRRLPYNHAIWHLFVMGGSAVHFFTILLFVLPLGVL